MDDDEIKDRQLNALVGGALRGLVESGADDEAVGAFAASYRQKAAKILGRPLEALVLLDHVRDERGDFRVERRIIPHLIRWQCRHGSRPRNENIGRTALH